MSGPASSDAEVLLAVYGLRLPAVDTPYSPLPVDAHICTFTIRMPDVCREQLFAAVNLLSAEEARPAADIAGVVGLTIPGAGDAPPALTTDQQAALSRIRDQMQLTNTAHQVQIECYTRVATSCECSSMSCDFSRFFTDPFFISVSLIAGPKTS